MGVNGCVCPVTDITGIRRLEQWRACPGKEGSPVERRLRAVEAIWALGTLQGLGKSPHLSGEFAHQLSRNDGMAFLCGQGCGAGPCR